MSDQDQVFNTTRAEEALQQRGGKDPINAIIPKGVKITGTTNATPDTEDTFPHDLGKVPQGFIVYSKDKAGDFYDSGTAWTDTNIYLKNAVASVAFSAIVF